MRLFSRLGRGLWVPFALAIPFSGCSGSAPTGTEVFSNSSASIRESDIRASMSSGQVELSFPLLRATSGVLVGSLSVALVDISKVDEPVLARGDLPIAQMNPLEAHTLLLTGLPADLSRANTAPLAIHWKIALSGGDLHGSRSLYAALGKLEVEVRGSTDIPEGQTAPFRIIARDPDTSQPKVGADVSVVFTPSAPAGSTTPPASTEILTGKTDYYGELLSQLQLPAGAESGSIRVTVKAGEADAWTTSSVRVVHERKISMSMDKTIYKPGQTLELRTLSLKSNEKTPLAGEEVTFEALDGKGNKVFKKKALTDNFGVAAMSVITDDQVNEGVWTLRALISGAQAEQKVPVARYNLPKMKISVSSDKEYAAIGDAIRGKVDARYLFGLPVAGGQVVVSLKLNDAVIGNQTGTIDPSGSFAYQLSVPAGTGGADVDDGTVALTVEAEVTDSAGQKETGDRALPLSNGVLVIKALPETGALVPGVENIVYLLVGDPVGRPIVASVQVQGLGPMQPLATDQDGVAELRFTPAADATDQKLDLTATDGANRSVSRSINLSTSSDAVLVLRTDKAVYKAGDTATVRLISSVPIGRAFVDVFKGGAGIGSLTLDASSGVATTMVPITEAMRGVIALDAFALGGAGTVIRGTQRLLVDPEDRLDIALSADQTTYAPGAPASVTVTVKNSAGEPQVASIGMTAVDEAVFALGGEPTSDLHAFFNLDARVLPPDLRVLGRSPADLFNARDPATLDRFARLLFASAKGVAGPALEYNSIREELPAVKTALQGRVTIDTVRFLKTIAPALHGKQINLAMAQSSIEAPANHVLDPFGRAYQASIDTTEWPQTLHMRSAGPDELMGTADDVTQDVWFGWVSWADASTVDDTGAGGWGRGGGPAFGAEGDANQAVPGAAPPPQVPNDPNHAVDKSAGSAAVKVRSDFRETVLVNPTLITDASGRAQVSFPLAQSITTWRVSAEGSTQNGKLGTARLGFRTFQEFFVDFDVPTTLTRGDTVELPAVVYNYLSTPQTVSVALDAAPWFELLSPATQSVTLNPSEVRSVTFKIHALKAGSQQLSIHGSAGAIGDALIRDALVMPDGAPEDQAFSEKLNGVKSHTITVPADAIEGGTNVSFALTPGFAGQAVQGVDALLKEPGGCFEQTTSSAWPNTLVTTYLDTTGQLTPELKEKAFGLVTRGYQRLLKFESPTGGFNWWGDADPGNRILSAIMLWHLKDMEKIIETDDAVRTRTLTWLLAQQKSDGSFASGDALHAGDEILGTNDVRSTAFIAWALAHTGWANDAVVRAAGYLHSHPADEGDLYANALAMNALAVIDSSDPALSALFAKLDTQKVDDGDGKLKWTIDSPSWTGAGGNVGSIETTSLIAYGMMKARAYPGNVGGAMRYLVANKDAVGSWYNTQATMNALRALLAAASPQGSDAQGTLTLTVNGQALPPITVTAADGDVYQKIDLTSYVHAGDNAVQVSMQGTGELTYQLARRAYRPQSGGTSSGPFALAVSYDTTSPKVGDQVSTHVTATFSGHGVHDQVMVRVGRAPGFAPRTDELDALVSSRAVSRYELNDRDVTFYVMGLVANQPRDLSFHQTATLVLNGSAPASSIYAYYDPTQRSEVAPVAFSVTAQ